MIELEAMRQRVKQNVLLLKREEEERKASGVHLRQSKSIGKVGSPDLKSFIQQFPGASTQGNGESTWKDDAKTRDKSSEPTGSGESFKPGTWQPPT